MMKTFGLGIVLALGAAGAAAAAGCNNLGGIYGSSNAIVVSPTNQISILMNNGTSPNVYGTCLGDKVIAIFSQNPPCCTGTFDGTTLQWDNGTSWTRNSGTGQQSPTTTSVATPPAQQSSGSSISCQGTVNSSAAVVNVFLDLNQCKIENYTEIRDNGVYLFNNKNNGHHNLYESHWQFRPHGGGSYTNLDTVCVGGGCGAYPTFCEYTKGECHYTTRFQDARGRDVTLTHYVPQGGRQVRNIGVSIR